MGTKQTDWRRLTVLSLVALGDLFLAVVAIRALSAGAPLLAALVVLAVPIVGLALIARETLREFAAPPRRTIEELLAD
jgi:hypothetical protein